MCQSSSVCDLVKSFPTFRRVLTKTCKNRRRYSRERALQATPRVEEPALAASAKEDADTYEVAEERATLADQYTEGVKGIPMTAQQAWAAAEAGERRQKEIMAGVGGLAQAIYQSVQAEIS